MQQMRKVRCAYTKYNEPNMFSGLLVCADCVGAGEGERVLVATGGAARVAAGAHIPIDAAIVGIIDGP